MGKVFGYSVLLTFGLVISQIPGFHEITWSAKGRVLEINTVMHIVLMILLAYIMIEAGLEFNIEKKHLSKYWKDFFIASTAAVFPWLFCILYFIFVLGLSAKPAFVLGKFAAPTSAGLLFTMLAAARLSSTWVYQKARTLAVLDDLNTILLSIPLQLVILGWKYDIFGILALVFIFLYLAYRFMHRIHLPLSPLAILIYAVGIWFISAGLEFSIDIDFEVLIPAFCFGIMLYNPYHQEDLSSHEKTKSICDLDHLIKGAFMILVGMILPKLEPYGMGVSLIVFHVLIITILSNFGKCFVFFFYKDEATLRERMALCVALFPRGGIGAGIFFMALSYGITLHASHLAGFSLGLNILLTGFFIYLVKWLLTKRKTIIKS